MHRILLLAVISGLAMSLHAQQPTQKHFDGQTWWNHVKVLADDNMEGRETGSAGLRKAEAYIVEQLTKAGLEAAGTQGFYQPVEIIERRIDERSSSASLIRSGKAEPLLLGEDAFFNLRSDLATREVTAPLIFVGYGLQVPERKLDELAGLDLHGKIVVYLAGSPADIPTALAAHYQSMPERWKALRAAGAIGTISIPNPASMDIPWSRMSLNRAHPSMELAAPELQEAAGLEMALTFNPARAEKLFAGSASTFAAIAALGKDRKPLPHFALAASLKARASVKRRKIESANLVARLPGTDPRSRTNTSSSPPTSTTSGSARPSTATASTTAPWTTVRAARCCSTWPPTWRRAQRSPGARSCSSSSPGRRKACWARSTSPPIPRSLPVHGRRHQRGHVPAHRPRAHLEGPGTRRIRLGRPRRRHRASARASRPSPTPSRCATVSSAATSTASSVAAFPRSSWTSASSSARPSRRSSRIG